MSIYFWLYLTKKIAPYPSRLCAWADGMTIQARIAIAVIAILLVGAAAFTAQFCDGQPPGLKIGGAILVKGCK